MWETKYFCVKCEKELSYYAVMYSHGRCPLCGYKGPHAGTIVDTFEKAAKWVQTAPWWRFWGNQGYWEIKEEENESDS